MAETTEFNHDQLGHILSDHLVEVPVFQRSYSWERANVQEFLADLAQARAKKTAYFMGTLVFAQPENGSNRRKIVDGQQRLATTAVLFVAIRDVLHTLGRDDLSQNISSEFLRRFDYQEEGEVDTLILSPKDQDSFDSILRGEHDQLSTNDRLRICYEESIQHLSEIAPRSSDYKSIVAVVNQLSRQVQVLVAVATNLPEAYVIFETLNDRGADLTTADLLKNYLFSQAKRTEFQYVQLGWNSLETNLQNKPEELVKFVRYDYVSRNGRTTTRKLYRALQDDLLANPGAKAYVQRLKQTQEVYLALRDPESPFWKDCKVDVRDALLAYRRFGFESSYPLLLAAFREWDKTKASRLLVKLAKWSVRAQFAGRLGAGTAEEGFATAAAAIASKEANNQTQVRKLLSKLIPTDSEFKVAFASAGRIAPVRVKYVLAMIEKSVDVKDGRAERAVDWASTSITIEHVLPLSAAKSNEALESSVHELGNLTLLEKKINNQLGSEKFDAKTPFYKSSEFRLTQRLADLDEWGPEAISKRTANLAELACLAWPAH